MKNSSEYRDKLKSKTNINVTHSNTVTATNEELANELLRRTQMPNPCPMHVFNPAIKPYINALVNSQGFDIPPDFVALTLMVAYSTAIGAAATVSTNGQSLIYLPVWGCNLGISSSGKSLVISQVLEPLEQIQRELDYEWTEKTKNLSHDRIAATQLQAITYRQSHIPTLVKTILPDNPKGVLKINDELLEWINGLNQLSKKEGTDEQFWLSTWNCTRFDQTLSGKQRFVLHRPFVNVIGGTQYKVLPRFFEKDRDTSGFVFRILFASPAVDKIAQPNGEFIMPPELKHVHKACIVGLHKTFAAYFADPDNLPDEPIKCILSKEAYTYYQYWYKQHINRINALDSSDERDTQASILGKIKEYALRFAAIFCITDRCYDAPQRDGANQPVYTHEMSITTDVVKRAVELADYFFYQAVTIYEDIVQQNYAPQNVLVAAYMLKQGKSFAAIGKMLFEQNKTPGKAKMSDEALRKTASRLIKKWIVQYPRVFNANAR